MASKMSWFPFWQSAAAAAASSSDPDDVGNNLMWLEEMLQDDKAWLDEVEARVYLDAQTEIEKEEIKEWAYDAEDVLDEWKFEQLRTQAEPAPAPSNADGSARGPVADLLMDPSFRDRVTDLKLRRAEILAFNHLLRLGRPRGPRRQGKKVDPPPTSSLPGEREVHGRVDDCEMLVKFLMEGATEERLTVIPILGAGGVGKTTLAQKIYNDPVIYEICLLGWVSASRGRQMVDLMKAFAESLVGGSCNVTQLEVVQDLLKGKIDGRRVLLVLDDVWYETIDGGQWEKLCATFSDCLDGSVIMLTTQDERVADRTKTVPAYILESLSGDLCWSVFRKHAFSGSLPTDDRLNKVGQKIAKECQGSPLVAKALGLRLRHERHPENWEEFLQRDMWDEVVPELKLSYHRLPAHLKRCFVYCSMFPEGYLFNREELVRLWVAQGFIEEEEEKSLEDVGIGYFDDLSIMSFFQHSELDTGAFVMPKLLHALAQSISDGECVTIENSNLCNLPRNDLQKARHLSSTPSNSELSTKFLSFATHLRSFLVVPTWPLKNIARISFSDTAFNSLNCLRVLDVRHTDIEVLPKTISNLKHLRYLNLSGTKIEHVDASLFRLYSLQTLDLSCTNIKELPDTIGNLSNLLHLRLNVTKITELPESIGKLSKLQTLHLGLTEIEELPETIGDLKWLKFLCLNVSKIQRLPESICGISNLQTLDLQGTDDGESNCDVILNDRNLKEQFSEQSDRIILSHGINDMADSNINSSYIDDEDSSSKCAIMEENVCENLQPQTKVQQQDYLGGRLLMWMGSPSFSKVAHVVLKNCMQCKTVPQLGQLPLLKGLSIDGMPVESVGQDFCGHGGNKGFPSLEKLTFQNMYKWKLWDGVKEGDFPFLDELAIFNCPKLKEVPCLPSSLAKLKVERCAIDALHASKSLQELQLCACDNLSVLPTLDSLSNLTLMYCQNLKYFPVLPSLEQLWIEECEQLSQWSVSLPTRLELCKLSSTTFLACKDLNIV